MAAAARGAARWMRPSAANVKGARDATSRRCDRVAAPAVMAAAKIEAGIASADVDRFDQRRTHAGEHKASAARRGSFTVLARVARSRR
jgi:hypothetical protein